MTLYDDMMEGVIDVHCHIDFEFSAKERNKRQSPINAASDPLSESPVSLAPSM